MIEIQVFDETKRPEETVKDEIIDFLFVQLEQYGDPREQISQCADYALKLTNSFGGYMLTARSEERLVGAVIINKTGMGGYIPANILVYIATHKEVRGQGVGKKLMSKALDLVDGDMKLHVEPDNPARFLYEKFGFTNKYLEMRYSKS